MTQYNNLVQDYPKRCADILEKLFLPATDLDREVTLLLMATAGGFMMPYERLIWGDTIKQPNINRSVYKSAMNKLSDVLGVSIKESYYFKDILSKWRFGKPSEPVEIEEILYAYDNSNKIDSNMKIAKALKILRNSIAHGNVLSIPDTYNVIQDLIFLSGGEKRDGTIIPYKLVVLTPKELKIFLLKWFELLSELPVPQHEVLSFIDELAI